MRTVTDIKTDMEVMSGKAYIDVRSAHRTADKLWIELAYILAERAGVANEAIMEIEAAWDRVDRWYA